MNPKGPQGALFAKEQMFLTLATWFDRSVKGSMKKQPVPPNADAYVAGLGGWQRTCVERLRAAVTRPGLFGEVIKWGHLVYLSNGPAILIRAEDTRVLFGFWRGRRLISIQPLLKPGGKYEMARVEYREGDVVDVRLAERLAREAHRLNAELGNPTDI
jgi:hypothetical protein